MFWVCCGGAAQLIVVSSIWAWLPSFLNRYHGIAPEQAGAKAALVVLCGALGSVIWGAVVDRTGKKRKRNKLFAMAALCLVALAVLMPTFGANVTEPALALPTQFALIAVGGFMMTCTVGPVSAVVIDVVHPGVRATGASVLALFQNLFGLAAGPFLAGVLSDSMGLAKAMTIIPASSALAAIFFLLAARSYERDLQRVGSVHIEAEPPGPAPGPRKAMA
jgi:MFS family permease